MTKRLVLLILSLAGLVFTLPAAAQLETEPLKPLYFYWQINDFESDGLEFAPGEAAIAPAFPRAIYRRILDETEYIPLFIRATNAPAYTPPLFVPQIDYDALFGDTAPTVSARIDTFEAGEYVRLTPYAAFVFPPLPMSTQGWTASLRVDPDGEVAQELAIQIAIGMALYTAYDCTAALPYFDSALAIIDENGTDPFDGLLLAETALFYRGNCLYMLDDDVDSAIVAYQDALTRIDALEAEPDQPNPLQFGNNTRINLAYIHLEQGNTTAALELLAATANVDLASYGDRELGAFITRAELYIEAGETDLGLAEFDRFAEGLTATGNTLSESRLGARFHTGQGRIMLDLGRYQDALTAFEQAITADESYAPAYYWRGVYYDDQGENALAIADFNTFIEVSTSFFDYYQQDISTEIADAETRLDQLQEGD